MDTNKILALLAVAGVGYMIYRQMNNGNSNNNERRFRLPDGRVLRESELIAAGYVRTPAGWVDGNTYQQMQNRLRNGESWSSIINTVASSLNTLQNLDWSGLTNGNALDVNQSFSTWPTDGNFSPGDFGLDDWGNVAGIKYNTNYHEFLY